jgi:hypothetical protein
VRVASGTLHSSRESLIRNEELAGHRDVGNLPPTSHHQVKILTTPFRKAVHRPVPLAPQKTQRRIAMLTDVTEPSPIPAGIFRCH